MVPRLFGLGPVISDWESLKVALSLTVLRQSERPKPGIAKDTGNSSEQLLK